MKKKIRNYILIGITGVGILAASLEIYQHYETVKEEQRLEEEAQKEAEEEKVREKAEKEKKQREIRELEEEATEIANQLDAVGTDEAVCADSASAAQMAKSVKKEVEAFKEANQDKEDEIVDSSLEILKEAKTKADVLITIADIDEEMIDLYDPTKDTVVMNTSKANMLFLKLQQDIWKVPEKDYPTKTKQYETAVRRISEEWNFVNDDTHYESSTLKVEVQEKKTSYTKYWICHIQTFSTQQLVSALCGGTYGSPRVVTSQEVKDHNGVIGINGSGFDYGSGIPAPGKSMIKDGKVYSDIYSNGNIFCVTDDGGMFTAIAGMTTKEMKNRGVRDTYCFGPTLVENGKAYEITSAFQQTYRYQRTAVGMVNPGDYYIVIVDGKGAGGSQGMTYEEIQKVFLDLNCQYAYNLDGGGSTTLVFKGKVLNTLTDGGNERAVADILYFIDAGDGGEGDDIIVHDEEAMLQPASK